MSDIKYNKEELYPKSVSIYTEANPNPNSMKFMLNFMLIKDGQIHDFPDKETAVKSPLATALFEGFSFIERVFYMGNFITITKNQDTDWMAVVNDLKNFVKDYFEAGKPLFTDEEIEDANGVDENDSEAIKKIKGVLDEYIRPAVEMDGGAIQFHSFDEESGVVKVLLQGACSGCPSSTVTLKNGIENMLKRLVPTVKEVVAEGV